MQPGRTGLSEESNAVGPEFNSKLPAPLNTPPQKRETLAFRHGILGARGCSRRSLEGHPIPRQSIHSRPPAFAFDQQHSVVFTGNHRRLALNGRRFTGNHQPPGRPNGALRREVRLT